MYRINLNHIDFHGRNWGGEEAQKVPCQSLRTPPIEDFERSGLRDASAIHFKDPCGGGDHNGSFGGTISDEGASGEEFHLR